MTLSIMAIDTHAEWHHDDRCVVKEEPTQMEHLMGPPSRGWSPSLDLTLNMTGTNTLAFCGSFSDKENKF
jgi:hypothetical protein